MCILFSYISKCVKPGEYKLILLSNRDEFFFRPAKAAHFITKTNIYGTDLTPGKEGGTWLGLNKEGKIGALLNLNNHDYGSNEGDKGGRGFLVPNYLNSRLDNTMYSKSIENASNDYNPFNLLLYEIKDELWDVCLFDNYTHEYKKIQKEFVSISNHLYDKPYLKTKKGEQIFKEIVENNNKVSQKNQLLEKLFQLCKYDPCESDSIDYSNIESVKEMHRKRIYISDPVYGTRTHTIIMVDDKDNVTYYERTLKCPIEESKKEWEDSVFEFQIERNQSKND